MAGYLELARAALAERRTSTVASPHDAARAARYGEISEKSEKRSVPLRATIEASADLRVLLGLDPPPPPAVTCRYCGQCATSLCPLSYYLDGHADHGGFCPPRRRRRKTPHE
jgi:hypothetical protein